ncbi:CbtA family protein [Solirubrobacter phytolaccae]|uniref:CbtA family protein n=1 Tax=Solirubrobacter phytolaccae TaxID=1404360 RepID=A0A9X3S8X0_9ACTN|nr:CbtA family protein [Solirubrobacter phytolaccae]MDA0182043.1 CbtA family protein [Solirubrobacter phytolaccae]
MDSQKIVRGLLIRGMLAGLAAGVLMWAFGYLFGEPHIRDAIAFEESISPPSNEAPLVSRTMQESLGLLTGTVVYAIAAGGVFALVFAAVFGRVGHARPRVTAATLGLVAFVVIVFVPFLKYPSNPPAVSLDETIGFRTRTYFVMLLLSLVAAFAALRIGRDAVKRLGTWNGTLVAVAGYVVLAGIASVLMPAVKEMPEGFSPELLYSFRLSTLGTHAVLYATLGLGFGALAERWISQVRPAAAGTYRTSSLSAGAPHS